MRRWAKAPNGPLLGAVAGLLGLGLLAASPAQAAPRELAVTVVQGDTPESLAQRYYGRRATARLLLAANGRDALAKTLPELKPGERLRLPTAWSYQVREGDGFAQLAKDYLGDKRLVGLIRQLNGLAGARQPPAGRRLVMPAIIRVNLARPVALSFLVARLLGRPPRDTAVVVLTETIARVNTLDRIAPAGKRLLIPVVTLRLGPRYLPNALPAGDPGRTRRARLALGHAHSERRSGSFLAVLRRLLPLLATIAGLPKAVQLEVQRLLCTTYVALERSSEALVAARAALALDPKLVLDPRQVSPTVRAVYARARGRR